MGNTPMRHAAVRDHGFANAPLVHLAGQDDRCLPNAPVCPACAAPAWRAALVSDAPSKFWCRQCGRTWHAWYVPMPAEPLPGRYTRLNRLRCWWSGHVKPDVPTVPALDGHRFNIFLCTRCNDVAELHEVATGKRFSSIAAWLTARSCGASDGR